MENLIIKRTQDSPEVSFSVKGDLNICGVSIPENALGFYSVLINWLNEFEKELPTRVKLTLDMDYLNTSSNRLLVEVLRIVVRFKAKCNYIEINWMYEANDDDGLDLGKDLEYCAKSPFKFIEKNAK